MQMNRDILAAALVGLEAQRDRVNEQIKMVKAQLGIRGTAQQPKQAAPAAEAPAPKAKKKRKMSAAARKRISDAQKKRWAAVHSKK
jgi:hypothetical protein